jgi:hypothetical protein
MMSEIPEPIEDVDYFRIKRLRYELHVEGTVFMTADEECDDFEIDAARIDLSAPEIVSQTVLHSVERRIDDPTKPFDRGAWYARQKAGSIRPHERKRPENERTIEDYAGAV